MPTEFDHTLARVMQFMVEHRINRRLPSPEEVAALVAVCEEYRNVRTTLQQIGSKLIRLKRTKVFPPANQQD
jgi:uncharacterized protein YifE (UPF0438 family)